MNWFSNNTSLENISLGKLSDALNSKSNKIQLPSFQRDAVWDEQHVELLWDSIIRKFPIGSLLFAQAKDYDQSKMGKKGLMISKDGESKRISKELEDTEFIIIDGQQRLISIALGFKIWELKDPARLWIDLGNRKTDKHDENFLIRVHVCSNRKPWGINATSSQINEALRMIRNEKKQIVDLEQDDFNRKDEELLNKTWPVRASVPVPFISFRKAVDEGTYKNWKALIPKHVPNEFIKKIDDNTVQIEEVADKIRAIKNYEIPLYLIERLETIEDLGTAFQRINRQGVPMSDDDLFFSGLKMVWPESHDLVWEIYDDPKTGKFLQPTGIVHNVIRLSAANTTPNGRNDILDLNLKEFKSLIDPESINTNVFFNKVQTYLDKADPDSKGKLHENLMKAKMFLQYDQKYNPLGMPLPLLSRLNKRVWHTITAWIDRHDDIDPTGKEHEESRKEMIRYALFDMLYLQGTSTGLMRLPFEIAFMEEKHFPGIWIYREMIERNYFSPDFSIYTPETFKDALYNKEGFPNAYIFNDEISLLHWNQREFMNKWFPNYDPTLYRTTDDLPYDVDHIIAGAHFHNIRSKDTHETFWNKINRTGIVNTAGNYRLWPKSLNRSDQDDDLWVKHILGDKKSKIKSTDEPGKAHYLTRKPYEFINIGEVRAASCIGENDLDLWEKAANKTNVRDWSNPERIDAFITVVQNRRHLLFVKVYESLQWNEWLNEKKTKPFYLTKEMPSDKAEEREKMLTAVSNESMVTSINDKVTIEKIQNVMNKIIQDSTTQKYCSNILAESIIECNNNGSNKWGVTVYGKAIFLNYGSIAVVVMHKNGIDLCMSTLLDEKYEGLTETERGYNVIESTWAHYIPTRDNFDEVWSKLKINHFLLIQNAAQKFNKLREQSKSAHSNEFVEYLETTTGKKLPRPNY